jgi:hypothetical protein
MVSAALWSTSEGVVAQEAQQAAPGSPAASADAKMSSGGSVVDPNAPAAASPKAIDPASPTNAELPPAQQDPSKLATTAGGQMECHQMSAPTGSRFGAARMCGQRRQWEQGRHDAQWSLSRMQMMGMMTPHGSGQ